MGIAIVTALQDVIQFFKGSVHPQVIAAVIGGEEIACFRMEGDVERVAHPGGKDFTFTGLDIESQDRRAARIGVFAGITGGTYADV
jgi:hypothetical protein